VIANSEISLSVKFSINLGNETLDNEIIFHEARIASMGIKVTLKIIPIINHSNLWILDFSL
jgi:hypothetical protein